MVTTRSRFSSPVDLALRASAELERRRRGDQGDALTVYRDDPVGFVRQILGVEPWSIQRDILDALNYERARVAVKACHASGKSFIAAAAASWFLNTRRDSAVLTTAPTDRQVKEIIWREIRNQTQGATQKLRDRLLGREPRWEVGPKWFALGLSTNEPERFQGFHNPSILVIQDEASGIPEAIHQAIEGVLSSGDARLLMIGNPTQVSGHFHAAFTKNRATGTAITISAFDTPNLTGEGSYPYLVSPDWVQEKRAEWGEDSDLYRVRVLGEFPRGTLDTVIALADIEAARGRMLVTSERLEVGVDVARFGDDRTVIVGRSGPVVLGIEVLTKRDTVFTAGRTAELADQWASALGIPASHVQIKVDDAAMGGGVTDQLRAMRRPVVPINASERAVDPERYPNRRSELWFATGERAADGDLDLTRLDQSTYDVLVAELTAPRWSMDSRGRRVVEPKDAFKKRLGRSPDLADAFNLAFAPAPKRLALPSMIAGGVAGWQPRT